MPADVAGNRQSTLELAARLFDSPVVAHIPVMRLASFLLGLSLAGCGAIGHGASATTSAAAAVAPASFVRSTSEALVTRMIDVREGITHTQGMRMIADVLGQRYTVEVTDPRAGFAMTAWQASLQRDGVPDLRYRTRVTAKFLGDDWRKLQLRDEANWQRGEEWEVGYDAAQLDSVASDLRAKLGKKP